jgi:hypothetical protein
VNRATLRVRPGWRDKALVQQGLSAFPASYRFNYWFQRRVSKRLPLDQDDLSAITAGARRHLSAYAAHGHAPLAEAIFFEFGSGWDMGNAIALFLLGVRRQILVDLRPLARPELIDDILRRLPEVGGFDELRLREFADLADAAHREPDPAAKLRCFGIDCRAPADARATALPPSSVDCITSTAVLEHVPAHDVAAIFRELHRVLVVRGVMSCEIDYHDHYSTFDRSITPYNFLRYSDRRWRIFNSSISYQNRLRHSQYLSIARDAGFELIDEQVSEVGQPQLEQFPLARPFRHLPEADLAITQSHLVLRKRPDRLAQERPMIFMSPRNSSYRKGWR